MAGNLPATGKTQIIYFKTSLKEKSINHRYTNVRHP